MSKLLIAGLSAFVLLTIGFAVLSSAEPAAPPYQPFTAVLETTRFDSDEKMKHSEVWIVAQRGDGARVRSRRLFNGERLNIRIIEQFDLGVRMVVDDLTKSKTTYALESYAKEVLEAWRSTGCTDASEESESGELLGHEVVKGVQVEPWGNQGWFTRTTSLKAPGLNCLEMHRTEELLDAEGALSTKNVHSIAFVTLGEPQEELFAFPSSVEYVERTPSEVMAEGARLRGSACCQSSFQAKDEAYYRSRQELSSDFN